MIWFVVVGFVALAFYVVGWHRGKRDGEKEAILFYGKNRSTLPRVTRGVVEPFDYEFQSKRFPKNAKQTRALIFEVEAELRRCRIRRRLIGAPFFLSLPLYVLAFYFEPLGFAAMWFIAALLMCTTAFLERFNYKPRLGTCIDLSRDLPFLYYHRAVLEHKEEEEVASIADALALVASLDSSKGIEPTKEIKP